MKISGVIKKERNHKILVYLLNDVKKCDVETGKYKLTITIFEQDDRIELLFFIVVRYQITIIQGHAEIM